jgi:hypothetical protein
MLGYIVVVDTSLSRPLILLEESEINVTLKSPLLPDVNQYEDAVV